MKPTNHPLRAWRFEQTPRRTLTALAEELGVTASHLSEIENWNNEPSLTLASRLHNITGIDMKEFARPEERESAA